MRWFADLGDDGMSGGAANVLERIAKADASTAWAVNQGVKAAVDFIEEQIESGLLDGGIARCRATTRKGKPCQRTPLPERDYCPSHQHLETKAAA